MSKMPYYAVRISTGEYLQGVDINENYCRTGTAPTMGVRHSFNEFKTTLNTMRSMQIISTSV